MVTKVDCKWRKVAVTTPQGKLVTVTVPSREDIENLQVGDVAPYCFGEARVTRIYARGITAKTNRAYVLYYVAWCADSGSTMSASATEGEIDEHAGWYVDHLSSAIAKMQAQADLAVRS